MPGKFEKPRNGGSPAPRSQKPAAPASQSPRRSAAPQDRPAPAAGRAAQPQRNPQPQRRSQTPPQRPQTPRRGGVSGGTVALLLLALAVGVGVVLIGFQIAAIFSRNSALNANSGSSTSLFSRNTEPTAEVTTEPPPPETTLPVPEHVVSTATIGAMGDLLMHKPVIDSGLQSDGSYDFTNIFKYLSPALAKNDYNAANLETTLAGTAKPYSGYPNFNCPDAIAEYAQKAGFQMLLTSNNHCYDTSMQGYLRTLEVTKGMGFDTIGTMASPEDPKYIIKEINGIKIGMVSYTYETSDRSGNYPSLNGLPMYDGNYDIINTFVPTAPQRMYDELTQYLAEMKEAGAEATIMFIHWGVEYILYANDNQKQIAQKLCDLGFDAIIGGHPHVVEPVALLESTVDPSHKTVCIYSMGNAVSNQRLGNLSSVSTAHTEDGVLFSVSFEKYSDGKVYMSGANAIPTWVNLKTSGPREYNILPLDEERDTWMERYDLSEAMLRSCDNSYARTMAIVGEGLEACRNYLEQQKVEREAYYYDLAFFPEKFATEATEAVEETVVTDAESALETEAAETVSETQAA